MSPTTDPTIDDKGNSTTISTSTIVPPPVSGAMNPPMKMLSPTDLADVWLRIGAPPSLCIAEGHTPSASSTRRVPADVPPGLYREVICSRRRAQINYYLTATLYNTCIVLQLLFGAALTGLGASTSVHGLSITVLAAANTVNAGLIALLHNSGLPNRIKQDWNEFAKVEMVLEKMIYTGLVETDETKVDAVARCWDLYNSAKATVEKNKPSVYTTAPSAAAIASSV